MNYYVYTCATYTPRFLVASHIEEAYLLLPKECKAAYIRNSDTRLTVLTEPSGRIVRLPTIPGCYTLDGVK